MPDLFIKFFCYFIYFRDLCNYYSSKLISASTLTSDSLVLECVAEKKFQYTDLSLRENVQIQCANFGREEMSQEASVCISKYTSAVRLK